MLEKRKLILPVPSLPSTWSRHSTSKVSPRSPMSEFMALGLSEATVKSLKNVGQTEATHVSTLLSAISGAGGKPVEPCQYNFDAALAHAKTMVATARVLEAVGVSAYLELPLSSTLQMSSPRLLLLSLWRLVTRLSSAWHLVLSQSLPLSIRRPVPVPSSPWRPPLQYQVLPRGLQLEHSSLPCDQSPELRTGNSRREP